MTNLHSYYRVPLIIPPVQPDDPENAAPSDHKVALALPLKQDNVFPSHEYTTRIFRPLPDSGIRQFGQWVCKERWFDEKEELSPTEQVAIFEEKVNRQLDLFLPQKTVKLSKLHDKPYMTMELKTLNRKMMREYKKHQKSEKYKDMKASYEKKMKIAANNYLEKNVRSLIEEEPGKAYKCMKKLSAQPNSDLEDGSFNLLSHMEKNLSTEESANKIAKHFADICNDFQPLNLESLPENIQHKLSNENTEDLPEVSDFMIYKQICKSKKPRSCVPGDLPRRIVQEFSPELAAPVASIIRNIVKTGHWPKQWRLEYGTPLQKQSNPVTEDHIRIISLTSYLSKVTEQLVINWLMDYVGSQFDWGQYGGLKGSSISHYLIDLLNFILYNQDLKEPYAVLAVLVDYKQAFNRVNHNLIIKILSRMGVPGWLLRIVAGFFTDRELILRFKGCNSTPMSMHAGCPQGTKLGLLLFLLLINAAGYQDLEKEVGKKITGSVNKRKPISQTHAKYVDDLSLAKAINLKEDLTTGQDLNFTLPLTYHNRNNQVLANYGFQNELMDLYDYSVQHEMKVNIGKTQVMLFNNRKSYDFTPKLSIPGLEIGEYLEVVETKKLLGIIITSDLKWSANTEFICKKGYNRLWMLRRLCSLGATPSELFDIYVKQIRPILELAVPVWHPGLTIQDAMKIERVQKSAFHIILGRSYSSYETALAIFDCENLEDRRIKLCENFALKCLKSEKYSSWFCFQSNKVGIQTRNQKNLKLKKVQTRTLRYENSPLPYLTNLLNNIL